MESGCLCANPPPPPLLLRQMRTFLSGTPELKLGLNDKALFDAQGKAGSKKAVEMEDIKFHQ